MQRATDFAGILDATVLKITPHQDENEWTVELMVPLKVRRKHTALPGDRVLFRTTGQEHELVGTYQFRGRQAYIVLDDGGGVKREIKRVLPQIM